MKKILNKIITATIVSIFATLSFQIATAKENNVQYYMSFKVHQMKCRVELNGLYLIDTFDLPQNPRTTMPEMLSMGHMVGEFVNKGTNTLSILSSNLAEYVLDPENSYCEVGITAIVYNPETGQNESKLVSNIRYTYAENDDKDSAFKYKIVATESDFTIDPRLTASTISFVDRPKTLDRNQEEIQNITGSREIYVNHAQPFSWVNRATPFEDTPANRQQLWDKYHEIRMAMQKKDQSALKKLFAMGAKESAAYQNEDVDSHFNIVFSQLIQPFFELDDKYWQFLPTLLGDYELKVYADGKLFQLNQKEYSQMSPLQWKNPYTREFMKYNPVFTYIDGEIEVATF